MSNKTVIFLGGEQGSGKSTAAEFIQQTLHKSGFTPTIMKFADTVYELHHVIDRSMSRILGRDPSKKKGELLQIIGTEIGRNMYDKDIWVKATEKKIKEFNHDFDEIQTVIIVEDVRFKNEFDLCAKLNSEGIKAISIYFSAPEAVRKERVESFRANTSHPSELELSTFKHLFQYHIDTSDTLEGKNEALLHIINTNSLIPDAKGSLQVEVDLFNELLCMWEDRTGHGANFEWFYETSGKKRLRIKDVAPILTLSKDKAAVAVAEVQKVMETLDEPK